MTPSFSYRIDSMIQAMADIVLPAIDGEKSLAIEQAQLVIAHLGLMKTQLPLATKFDELELQACQVLANTLLEITANQSTLADARQQLKLAAQTPAVGIELQEEIRAVNGALENLIRVVRSSSNRELIEATSKAVLAHTQQQSLRNRVWFASNGFDADAANLPTTDSLFKS